jgi:hypothetical protein
VLDAVDDRLDQGRGLAGAGTGEHQQRAARVVDDALLVVVERGWCETVGSGATRRYDGPLLTVPTQARAADGEGCVGSSWGAGVHHGMQE